jgi:hypothetical protein
MGLKDVMIGDWVTGKKWRENPFKLTRINDNGKYYYGITSNGTQVGPFLLEEIEPIPLTTEILERNLHEPDEGVVWWKNDEPFYHVECLPLNGMRLIMPYTQYVHELQHALRLAGIDKEIKLED